MLALAVKLLDAVAVDRDVLLRQNAIDGGKVRILDDAMMVMLLGLLLGAGAGYHPDRIDADLLAMRAAEILGLLHVNGRVRDRHARGLHEEGVAVLHRKSAPG